MMRAIFLLSMVLTAGASDGNCELSSGEAVEHAIEGALFIWAATKRCQGVLLNKAPVKCEQDVASAIASVTAMSGAIAEMVGSCAGIHEANHKCGASVNQMISDTAGLAAVGGAIADKCAHVVPAHPHGLDEDVLEQEVALGKCTLDTGSGMNSIFAASNTLRAAKNHCDGSKGGKCATNALNVLSVLSNLGAFVAASVADCSAYNAAATKTAGMDTAAAGCSNAVLAGIADLSSVAAVGLHIKHDCAVSSSRLYELESNTQTAGSSNAAVFALAAMLPLTAVLSFVVGKRFAASRHQTRHFVAVEQELE